MFVSKNSSHISDVSNLTIPLQVVLGEVEMSIEELLKMEPGTNCKVNLPESGIVELVLGGEPIASAFCSMENNLLTLKIIEIFLNQEEKNCDNDNEDVCEEFCGDKEDENPDSRLSPEDSQ